MNYKDVSFIKTEPVYAYIERGIYHGITPGLGVLLANVLWITWINNNFANFNLDNAFLFWFWRLCGAYVYNS